MQCIALSRGTTLAATFDMPMHQDIKPVSYHLPCNTQMYTDSAKIYCKCLQHVDHLSIVTTDLQEAKLSGILNFAIFFCSS